VGRVEAQPSEPGSQVHHHHLSCGRELPGRGFLACDSADTFPVRFDKSLFRELAGEAWLHLCHAPRKPLRVLVEPCCELLACRVQVFCLNELVQPGKGLALEFADLPRLFLVLVAPGLDFGCVGHWNRPRSLVKKPGFWSWLNVWRNCLCASEETS